MDSPMVAASFQAGLLSTISNVVAQLITCWRAGTPYVVNITDMFQFAFFAVLACPPNYLWQSWLEAQYPAYAEAHSARGKEALIDRAVTGHANQSKTDESGATGKANPETSAPKLNKKNTALKFLLDQGIGGPVNTLLFIAGIGLIRGQSSDAIQADVKQQFLPMALAGLKLWPLVSLLNYTLVPLEYRMLLANVAGLFWGIYLSLVAGSA